MSDIPENKPDELPTQKEESGSEVNNKPIEQQSPTSDNKNSESKIPYLISTIAVIALLFVLYYNSNGGFNGESITGNVISNQVDSQVSDTDGIQVVKLSVQGSSYVLSPSKVKKGIPVKIEADTSNMPGCSKSVVVPAFNIRKTLTAGNNIIEFTPDKAGTFNIACSMNMYKGTFEVLEADGSSASYVEKQSASSGMSCGASGGGCGCGG